LQSEDHESKRQTQVFCNVCVSPAFVSHALFKLADRAFSRGIISSSSFVDESVAARGGEVLMSSAALSKHTSSTDISRKSRNKVILSGSHLFSLSVLLRSSSSQSTRYLFILPGNIRFASFSYSFGALIVLLRLTGEGQIGQMDKMDGKNPTLSVPLPDGSKLVR
jgi:hypothetical protein